MADGWRAENRAFIRGVASVSKLHPDRLFPSHPATRAIAKRFYGEVCDLPIISPHGHTDPRWFAGNASFTNAAELLLTPDHYLFRMLVSQGVGLDEVGVPRADGTRANHDPRGWWRVFARHYYLFAATPSRMWLEWVFENVFGLTETLSADNADGFYDAIGEQLAGDAFRPRALFDRFGIEVLTTTESPLDDLVHHREIRGSGWAGKVLTAYRPDPVVDPEFAGFTENVARLGELTGEDSSSWQGYLSAHRRRREFFMQHGATSTDHGHPSCRTADLPEKEAEALFQRVLQAQRAAGDAERFRAQMLTEMARMSIDDGLVMQIHPGSSRNHSATVLADYGRDKGFDIPMRTDYVQGLKPLLDRFGMDRKLSIIVFTLDESTYSRELAPLAGTYPCLKLGPAWWFHDSPNGMRRFRELTTETAGFYNTVGFNDDTRAFLSIPARHDVARRVDCAFLAGLVTEHRLDEDEAVDIARQLAYALPKRAYRLDGQC
jgi:glucuronate isomerase